MSDPSAPSAVVQIGQKVIEAGHAAFLVGPGLRDLLAGTLPSHFELSTDAPISEILKLFPNGVLIGKRRDTVMVPSQAGPVDVGPFRAGPRIESDLAHRDFTINAIAYDIADRKWVDPHGGRADLENGLIRAVGRARDRIDEDPIRALRGVRLAATRGWELDQEVETALESARTALTKIPREPVRRELVAILLSAGVARALEQLDRSRITSQLAPGATPGSGAVVARLPRDLELRLAGWLRGANVRTALQRLRFSRSTIDRVELLLRHHHADDQINTMGPAAAARFARRTGAHNLAALIALREAEIETAGAASATARNALQGLRELIASLHDSERTASGRNRLAISGADVMECLGCQPGRRVGRAIDYLAERIRLNPTLNSPDALRDLLRNWIDDTGDASESGSTLISRTR
jgi:tRNA nucleotidyltransferase/poly(A) polymerase